MIQISEGYLEKIAAGKRRILGMIKVYWTDPYFLKNSSRYVISSTKTKPKCLPQQIVDDSAVSDRKWRHLDGVSSFAEKLYPAPSTLNKAMAERGHMGWWSTTVSSITTCLFSPVLKLLITHTTPKSVFDVLVVGDDAYGEFPVDFKVRLYSAEGLYTFTITNNIFPSWRGEIPAIIKAQAGEAGKFDFRYVTSMELEISKWNKPSRMAKIVVFTAINEMTFTGDDIFTMGMVEELEVSEGGLPIGTASANEIDISFNNIMDKFYASNPDTDLSNVLLPNRKIKPYLGVQLTEKVYEWVPLGVFWSQGWNVTESSPEITATARDRMDLLRQMRYLGCAVQTNLSLYALAVQVLEDARSRMPDLEYIIDEELKKIIIPNCYLPSSDYMAALKTISEVCLGQVFADRSGQIRICGPKYFTGMKPWGLGEYVWVFDDGEEFIGETCDKVFTTAGSHKGILYVTEETTGQVVVNIFYIEVRETDLEVPYKVDIVTDGGQPILAATLNKVNTLPLRYELIFNQSGAKALLATVYSKSGNYYNSRTILIEVRDVVEGSFYTLEGGEGDVLALRLSPTLFELTWSSSGVKKIRTLIENTLDRNLYVEVAPDLQASWYVYKD